MSSGGGWGRPGGQHSISTGAPAGDSPVSQMAARIHEHWLDMNLSVRTIYKWWADCGIDLDHYRSDRASVTNEAA